MEKVVYFCPNCGKTVSRLKGNKDKLEKFTNRYLKDLEVII